MLISEINQFIKDEDYTLTEFKQEMNSKALINYYLSSLADLSHKPVQFDSIEIQTESEMKLSRLRKQSV